VAGDEAILDRPRNAAARLRGAAVRVALEDAPRLPQGTHYVARLVGLAVVDERGRELGAVDAVLVTGGTDLLRVRPLQAQAGDERAGLLIPLADRIVLDVDEERARITVRLPAGLEELNR
jgi:16S rRNA processing protein RimM